MKRTAIFFLLVQSFCSILASNQGDVHLHLNLGSIDDNDMEFDNKLGGR